MGDVMMEELKSTESNTVTGDCFFNREVEQKIKCFGDIAKSGFKPRH